MSWARRQSNTKITVTPCMMFIGFDSPPKNSEDYNKKWRYAKEEQPMILDSNISGLKAKQKKLQQKVKTQSSLHENPTAWETLAKRVNGPNTPFESKSRKSDYFDTNNDLITDVFANDKVFQTFWKSLKNPASFRRGREFPFEGSNSSNLNTDDESITCLERYNLYGTRKWCKCANFEPN